MEYYGMYNYCGNQKPDSVEGQLNTATQYYYERLLRRLIGCVKIENAPTSWDLDYLLTRLFEIGFIGIAEHDSFGLLELECGIGGMNMYVKPNEMIFANAVVGNFRRSIFNFAPDYNAFNSSTDGVLLYIDAKYGNASMLLRSYAQRLANCDSGIDVNLLNSKVAYVFECEDKTQSETAKEFYDQLTQGKPAVFIKKKSTSLDSEGFTMHLNNVKNTFIVPELLDSKRSIMNQFDTDIGINNSAIDKKERVNVAETESNNQEIENSVADWMVHITSGIRLVNKLFNQSIQVSYPFWESRQREEEERNGGDKSIQSTTD